jgi:hypothetical protein
MELEKVATDGTCLTVLTGTIGEYVGFVPEYRLVGDLWDSALQSTRGCDKDSLRYSREKFEVDRIKSITNPTA